MTEQITKITSVKAPYEFMDYVGNLNGCGSLNMYEPKKSRAKMFTWHGKAWICTGSCSSGRDGWITVDIREVVPLEQYRGPKNDNTKRGPDFYMGGTFTFKGQTWVMTDNEVVLEPDGLPVLPKPQQLSLFPEGII